MITGMSWGALSYNAKVALAKGAAMVGSSNTTGDGGMLPAEREIDLLPRSLTQAIDCLEQDEVVKNALGATYAGYYIQTKREEWRRYHNSVSQWETDNYLGVY